MTTEGQRKVAGVFVGVLPYAAGACFVLVTHSVALLIMAGILVTVLCTIAAYVIRKRSNRSDAAHRLMIDPFLYAFEFALTAVLIHYVAGR